MKFFYILPILLVLGCSEAQKPGAANQDKPAPAKENNIKLAIDGMTGRQAVNLGTQAMNKVKSISTQEKKDLDDVMK